MSIEILTWVKSLLEDAELVPKRSVFFTPHETYLPNGAHFPAIAIKDGETKIEAQAGGGEESSMTIEVIAWVEMTNDEAALIGNGGVLTLAKKAKDSLQGKRDPAIFIYDCRCKSIAGSKFFKTGKGRWLVGKKLTFLIEIEE